MSHCPRLSLAEDASTRGKEQGKGFYECVLRRSRSHPHGFYGEGNGSDIYEQRGAVWESLFVLVPELDV